MTKPVVVIIGAGPAGLTAAYELVKDGRYHPLVLESSQDVGGISRTVEYKGNRMDIGGHRFFSKSDWVMNWWREILPTAEGAEGKEISYQGKHRKIGAGETAQRDVERVMLVRDRLSRIYFLRKYFDYPIKLNWTTISNLGAIRIVKVGVSYVWSAVFFPRPERSLEDFLINRFGHELYKTFFKDYTEKVWGVPCHEISAEWGAQRIKGLSILEALKHAWRRFSGGTNEKTNTSLIEHFLYPRLGPGQLWQVVAEKVCAAGGEIRHGMRVTGLQTDALNVISVSCIDEIGKSFELPCDYVISTMAVKDLVAGMSPVAPANVATIAANLPYRDFITVGLLLSSMRANSQASSVRRDHMPPDNWIYIQESDVKIGRLQIFNNWSPDLVADSTNVWLGLEYFCQEGDELWKLNDTEMLERAVTELEKIGMIDRAAVLDGTVIRVPKTYPAYFGAYEQFPIVREWLDRFDNLFLVGRNGMHRYNNQDHSMLTAKLAVEAIVFGSKDKNPIWAVNVDDDYHEEAGK